MAQYRATISCGSSSGRNRSTFPSGRARVVCTLSVVPVKTHGSAGQTIVDHDHRSKSSFSVSRYKIINFDAPVRAKRAAGRAKHPEFIADLNLSATSETASLQRCAARQAGCPTCDCSRRHSASARRLVACRLNPSVAASSGCRLRVAVRRSTRQPACGWRLRHARPGGAAESQIRWAGSTRVRCRYHPIRRWKR